MEKEKRIPRDTQWLCPGCGALLGYLGQGGREIRIKYKDLYVTVEGGRIFRACRKCGRQNFVTDPIYEEYVLEKYGEQPFPIEENEEVKKDSV